MMFSGKITERQLGIVMWIPRLAAIITRLIFQKNLKGLGWKWGKTSYQLLSYLLPIFIISIV
jgi:hypothetical protein